MRTLSLFSLCVMTWGLNSSLSGAEPSGSLVLVQEGRVAASILLAEKPTASAQLAAYELQYYLKKISGSKLPIVREPARITGNRILVGESKSTARLGYTKKDFGDQEYLIKTFPNTLVLMGRDRDEFSEIDYTNYNSLYEATSGPMATC